MGATITKPAARVKTRSEIVHQFSVFGFQFSVPFLHPSHLLSRQRISQARKFLECQCLGPTQAVNAGRRQRGVEGRAAV